MDSRWINGLARAAFDQMVAQADGQPRQLAALAALALSQGEGRRAYSLALEARSLAPDDPEVLSLTQQALSAAVPRWHFRIVRDDLRNAAYEAALRRAVGPATRVLDIGSGTGLLALMAARAGAAEVITCEMNAAVADAAREIIELNGLSDRIHLVPRRSSELDPAVDMGGKADLLVSEIVSSDLLAQGVLPVIEDAVARLVRPGGAMIPSRGEIWIAPARWSRLDERRMGHISGFDLSPFNRLARPSYPLKAEDPALTLSGPAAMLVDFDFASGGPFPAQRMAIELKVEAPANGIVQWIRLQLDEVTSYENKPGTGTPSCWGVLFHPLTMGNEVPAGRTVRVHSAHDRARLRIWTEA